MIKKKLCLVIAIALIFISVACAENADPALNPTSSEYSENITADDLNVTVRFFDVGQGDSILIAFPDGGFMLIDAGVYNNKKAVTDKLGAYGVEVIEYAVFTHLDADHIGAAAEVINGYNVKNVIIPDATATSKTFDNLLSALEAHGETKVIKGEAGYTYDLGGAAFEVLSPFGTEGKNANETSVVLLMTYGDIKMLFMGDAEKSNETELINRCGAAYINSDLIKIGHHGSSTSSASYFLSAVSPQYAVISCGSDNPYGHPAAETLDTLNNFGITFFRTDTQGEITATTDGTALNVSAER